MFVAGASVETTGAATPPPGPTDPRPGPSLHGSTSPRQVVIPSLHISAQIENVAFDKDLQVQSPQNVQNVGWFSPGAVPGDAGDAVIDGHFNWYSGPAVFYHLDELKLGDSIRVDLWNGQSVLFHVTTKTTVPYTSTVPGLFTKGGPVRLSLITCGGEWDNGKNTYKQRLVVEAAVDSISRTVSLRHGHRGEVTSVARTGRARQRGDAGRGFDPFRYLRDW